MSKKEEEVPRPRIAPHPVLCVTREKEAGHIGSVVFPTGAKLPTESELAAWGLELVCEYGVDFASKTKFDLEWARNGDWASLADYLAGGGRVTGDIREFLIEVLRRKKKKPNNRAASLRTLEAPGGQWERVLCFITLVQKDGLGREAAITATAERFRVDRRTISRNIADWETEKAIARAAGGAIRAAKVANVAGPRYLISSTALSPHFMS
jgi:hypothetical protein